MPFQISTSASPGRFPMRMPSHAAPGNTAYRPAWRSTR